MTKGTGLNLSGLFKKELNKKEQGLRDRQIKDYLSSKGGIIIAISCKNGILLFGVSPDGDPTFFDVFDRIGLLGIGNTRDCKVIHSLATGKAYSTMLTTSKADIDSREIAEQISNELDERFRYEGGQRGPYKANFIIAELGLDAGEDFIELIDFSGGNEALNVPKGKLWKIYEVPTVFRVLAPKEQLEEIYSFLLANPEAEPEEVKNFIQANRKAKKKDDKKGKGKENENKEDEEKMYVLELFQVHTTDALNSLFNSLYSKGNIPTVQEAALFIGLLVRLFDERGGRLGMVYLDRNMLKKTKTERRRFHYILNRITSFDSRKPSDSWQDWEKLTAPVYRKVKKGELYPEHKDLIEAYEVFQKKKFNSKEKELFEKIQKKEMFKLLKGFLGKK